MSPSTIVQPHACPVGDDPTHVEVFECQDRADTNDKQVWSVLTCHSTPSSEAKQKAEQIQEAYSGSKDSACVSVSVSSVSETTSHNAQTQITSSNPPSHYNHIVRRDNKGGTPDRVAHNINHYELSRTQYFDCPAHHSPDWEEDTANVGTCDGKALRVRCKDSQHNLVKFLNGGFGLQGWMCATDEDVGEMKSTEKSESHLPTTSGKHTDGRITSARPPSAYNHIIKRDNRGSSPDTTEGGVRHYRLSRSQYFDCPAFHTPQWRHDSSRVGSCTGGDQQISCADRKDHLVKYTNGGFGLQGWMCANADDVSYMNKKDAIAYDDTADVGRHSTSHRVMHTLHMEAERYMKHNGMARSCAPHFNVNKVSNINNCECRYLGAGLTDKGVVQPADPFRVWKFKLASCEDEIGVNDALMEDVQHAAYVKAGGKEAGLDPSLFRCSVWSLPQIG